MQQLLKRSKTMVTVKDIARMTGVSAMTVSRALNEPHLVKEETRQKILKAVEESGYVQNRVAQSLIKGCTNTVCVYIPASLGATTNFVAQTISAIAERLGEFGYGLLLRRSISPKDRSYDGVIVIGIHIDEEDDFIELSRAIPAVLYGNSERFSNWVDVDNYRGIYALTEAALKKGHTKLAYMGMGFSSRHVVQRRQAFLDALRAHDICDPVLVTCENDEKASFVACKKLLEKEKVTAIVCATDLIALGAVHAIQRLGMKVPDDIAVTGFDGFGYEDTVVPNLTTAKQPLREVGIRLADTVIRMINGEQIESGVYVEPTLLVQQSL